MKIFNKIKTWFKKAYVRFVLLLAIAAILYFLIPYLMFLLIMLGLTPGLIICIVEIALECKPNQKRRIDNKKHINKKKDRSADLKKYNITFKLLGYCISFIFLIALFSWRTYDEISFDLPIVKDEMIKVTFMPPTTLPPPPPPPEPEPIIEKPIVDLNKIKTVDDRNNIPPDTEGDPEVDVDYIPEKSPDEPWLPPIETLPEFPGGDNNLLKYIKSNMLIPSMAIELGASGTVVLQFVVNEEGDIADIKIVQDVCCGCGKAAVRMLRKMPKWKPANMNGHPVSFTYTLPIRIVISGR